MSDDPKMPSRSLTEEDAEEILRLHKLGWFQNRIAAKFDVNPARVNEVIHGQKFPHLSVLKERDTDAPSLF
jgi:CRISPR/Cas system type I-B associated protein Csh2 (Cas7 group RAMP superfamily)